MNSEITVDGQSPATAAVDFGSFDRLTPISGAYGFDRGQPIDRLYIEDFLEQHAGAIRGRVLEIEDDRYTRRFGRRVTRSDVLHLHAGHPGATLAGDLADAPHLPAGAFDCVILTQTLQYVYDLHAAMDTLARILAPGGTLLLSVPGLSRTSDPVWQERWMWNFTSRSVRRLLATVFDPARLEVAGHGNLLAAVAFLHGLAVEDVGRNRLAPVDPGYEICITARALH